LKINSRAAGAPKSRGGEEISTDRVPLSISRGEMLIDRSDREFRRLIHRMLITASRLEAIREAIALRIGVTGTQYTMLMSILHQQKGDGIAISALADYLEVSGPHVTVEIGKLAMRDLVRKAANPRDKRGVLISLTPQGRERLLGAFNFIRAINDRLFDGVTSVEYAALRRFNEKFVGNTKATLDWVDAASKTRAKSSITRIAL